MKILMYLAVTLSCVYLIYTHAQESFVATQEVVDESSHLTRQPAMTIVFYQDVSGSITQNGVELVSSSTFTPYFDNVERNIELHFGVIENVSVDKLISLTLPAKNFSAPQLVDIRKLPVVKKRHEKERFLKAGKEYTIDSTDYYSDRERRISEFRGLVDSLLSPYRKNLSAYTDLSTSVQVADRVFAFSVFENTEKYLLLNSDGYDSFGNDVLGIKHDADVILINTGRTSPTSIDSLKPIRLHSPEQAIQYSLNNKNR